MAAITPTQAQQLIVLEVGDTVDLAISISVPIYWDSYADKALIAPRLQQLYTKRDAYGLKIGKLQDLVDTSIELEKVSFHQQIETLIGRLDATQAEIDKVEAIARANRGGASGQLTATAPITPASDPRTAFAPDPNNRQYRGDALLPPSYRRPF